MEPLVANLLEMFPEACPQFIKRLCEGKVNGPGVIDELITQILEDGYPKRQREENINQKTIAEQWEIPNNDIFIDGYAKRQREENINQKTNAEQWEIPNNDVFIDGYPKQQRERNVDQEKNTEQWEILKQILPCVDPNYLRIQYDKLSDKPEELEMFIAQEISCHKRETLSATTSSDDSSNECYPDGFLEQEMKAEKLDVLKEILPDADPDYLQRHYGKFMDQPDQLESLVEREMSTEQQLKMLKQILPNADPSYLRVQCDKFIDQPDELRAFITDAIETRGYPTLKDYLRKQKISAQQRQYTSEFNLKHFMEVIPDPVGYFEDAKRKPAVDAESQHYATSFLSNEFRRLPLEMIQSTVKANTQNLLAVYNDLENIYPTFAYETPRGETPMPELVQNIPLLQEIAYIQHRYEINAYLIDQKVAEATKREEAKLAGLLLTCTCCYDDEIMPNDIYTCENDCIFCKACVRKGVEVEFGNGKLDFPCFNDCSSHFSLQTLQAVLNPKMFSKLAIKKQLEEVKAAGIEDLETCPFCDFATIPPKDDKIFRCLNSDCMKESCRLCKEPSHVPLHCEEVEKDDEVKIRTYIENKMTEAMLRKCYKCGKEFIKTEGCNHITCTCGAQMCYVCGKPYKSGCKCNFGITSKRLHLQDILKGAEAAKREMGVDVDPKKLKLDPTLDLAQHYNEPLLPPVPQNQLNIGHRRRRRRNAPH